MKNRKRWILCMLVAIMTLSMTGCAGSKTEENMFIMLMVPTNAKKIITN